MTAAERLIELLQLKENEAVAVHNPSNMFYLTEGYTGEGVVYISAASRTIITDFRYTEQAERQAPGFTVMMTDPDKDHNALLKACCKADGVNDLRCEECFLTVEAYGAMKAALEDITLRDLAKAPEKLREIKTPREIELMRKACEITSETFRLLLPKIHEGMTETDLRIELDFLQLKLGAEGNSFDTIMAFGENGSLCHAIPGPRKLKRGDLVLMDFGCKYGGYCSDMTRTVAFGEPDPEMRKVYGIVQRVQQECREMVAPGKVCKDIHLHAIHTIDEAGYPGRMGHGLGHSVGIDIHENPRYSFKCEDLTQPGMVITVEPGIYLPGKGGVRIEDTVLVTEDGWESLTTAPRDLIIL